MITETGYIYAFTLSTIIILFSGFIAYKFVKEDFIAIIIAQIIAFVLMIIVFNALATIFS